MGVSVHWYDKPRGVLLYTYGENWSWMALYAAMQLRADLLRLEGRRHYHVIHDLGTRPHVPHYAIPNAYQLVARNRRYLETVIIQTPSSYVQRLVKTGLSLHPGLRDTVFYAPTLQAAEHILSERAAYTSVRAAV